jgi:L-ascorbate 6-phosphate lactonase
MPNVGFGPRLAAWRPPSGSIGLVALGQAGIAVRGRDELVLIDPFLSSRPDRVADAPVRPDDLAGIDLVLATHEHVDHLDLPAWTTIAQRLPATRFVVPEPLVPLVVAAGIPDRRIVGARLGVPIELGGVVATPVPARHAVEIEDGYSLGDQGGRVPRFMGYVVEVDGVRLYHAGDTLADERLLRSVADLRPEIAFLPINGRDPEREQRGIVGNLSPDEAADVASALRVALAVPIHFDGIRGNEGRPDAFVSAMRVHSPTTSVWVPGTGGGFVWPASAHAWHATSA